MDDNTLPKDTNPQPVQQAQPQQPIAPLFSGSPLPQNEPEGDISARQSMPPQPASTQPNIDAQTGEAYGQSSGPRLTLEDMYGTSRPSIASAIEPTGETPQAEEQIIEQVEPLQPEQTVQSQPIEPIQPTEPLQPMQPEQPIEAAPVEAMPEMPQTQPAPEAQSPTVQEVQPMQQLPVQPASAHVEPLFATHEPQSEVEKPKPVHIEDRHFGFPPVLKFLIGGLLILLLIFVVYIIGSSLFKKSTTTGHVTLTYWGLWEDAAVMQPILADFQKQHPNITVEYSKQDPKDYVPRLLTRTQAGQGPDIFRFNNSWAYPLQSMLLPLSSSIIDVKALQSQYPPVVSQDLVQNGAVYGLPTGMDTLALFVNKDIFSHAGATVPTTWDSFITVAKALTVKDPTGHIKTSGAALGTYENIEHAPDIFSLLLLQNGANLQKLDGSKNANDALTFYTSVARPEGNVWDSSLDNSLLAFERGNLAMYFGYSYDIFAIKAVSPQLNFAVYQVPHLPGRDMTIANYWIDGVSSHSKNPKEAMMLLQYLAQKDTQTRIYTEEAKTRLFGELYANTDLADGLKENQLLAPFIAQYKGAESTIFAGNTDYNEYNEALNGYLKNAINSTFQDTSVESAMTTLSQGVSQITAQYGAKSQ